MFLLLFLWACWVRRVEKGVVKRAWHWSVAKANKSICHRTRQYENAVENLESLISRTNRIQAANSILVKNYSI